MAFKNLYSELLTEKKQNPECVSDEAAKILPFLDMPEKWFEALAICETAVDANKIDESVLTLYKSMFTKYREFHSSMNLSDEDYAEWFARVVDCNRKFIKAGIHQAWIELEGIYITARYPFLDKETARQCMMEGVKLNEPVALAHYGYNLFFGRHDLEINREEARKAVLKSMELGYEKAESYLIMFEYDTDADTDIEPDVYEQKIKDYNAKAKPENQLWHLLGSFYKDFKDDIEKAIEAEDNGIKIANDAYCKYNKAMLILNNDIKDDFEEALNLLKEAYDWGITQAADFLGQFYYHNTEYLNLQTSIEWYKKAIAYYNVYSMFNLAVIYLYNDEVKDIEKGIRYLDMAIAENYIRAINEKAFFMIENEEYKDIKQAKELFEKSYELGDGYAAFRLGLGYQNAEFSEEYDYKTAFQYYTAGYERGNLYATELMGRYYKLGLVEDKPNPEKAIELYNKAIEENSSYARVELAICYEEGFGVEQDDSKAFELLKIAADDNYTYAHTKLGYYYLNGFVGKPDLDKAFEHFSKAAEHGDTDAIYNLGRIYKYAIGKPENPELALQYFVKAADNGNEHASIELALAYEMKYGGLEFDTEKIMKYMGFAAERNHPYALYKTGCYYYYGMIEEDSEKGLEYFYKSFECGSPLAALALGDHFLYAPKDDADYGKAFEYYCKAKESNYVSDAIGLCYLFGLGTEKNETEAFKYFSIAADKNYTNAKYRLGCCYKYGTGTNKNLAEACKWLKEAAEEGNRNAEYEIGMLMLNGEGVSMNPAEGIEWLKKAAEKKHDNAQLELGNCYLQGLGVEENEEMATYWYQRAAENGNETAQKITGKRNKKRK